MKNRYLFPGAVALGLHALLLLGFNDPSKPRRPVRETEVIGCDFQPMPIEPDEPPPISLTTECGGPSTPSPQMPEEFTKMHDVDFPQPARDVPPQTPRIPIGKIEPGVIGPPNLGEHGLPPGDGVFSSALLDNPPRTKLQTSPAYPYAAKQAGLTGEVVVEFVVDQSGHVRSPRVVRSTDFVFEAAALQAVAKWRFAAGMKDGRAVSFRMMVPILFNLGD